MINANLVALRASARPLFLIGGLATIGAGLMTLIFRMDTPLAPWDKASGAMFPPVLFTLASFFATVAFCASTVVFHTLLKLVTNKPDTWWRTCGILFLLSYGTFTFFSQTTEAAVMLNILHLIVGISALILLPSAGNIEGYHSSLNN